MWNLTSQPLKISYFHYHNSYSHPTWQGGDAPWVALTHQVMWPLDPVFLQDHMENWKCYIPTTKISIATKFGRLVTYHEEFPPIRLHEPLITWSWKITWKTMTLAIATKCDISYSTLRSRGPAISPGKVKPLYLNYHSVYG